jgi:hypothetical protein
VGVSQSYKCYDFVMIISCQNQARIDDPSRTTRAFEIMDFGFDKGKKGSEQYEEEMNECE